MASSTSTEWRGSVDRRERTGRCDAGASLQCAGRTAGGVPAHRPDADEPVCRPCAIALGLEDRRFVPGRRGVDDRRR